MTHMYYCVQRHFVVHMYLFINSLSLLLLLWYLLNAVHIHKKRKSFLLLRLKNWFFFSEKRKKIYITFFYQNSCIHKDLNVMVCYCYDRDLISGALIFHSILFLAYLLQNNLIFSFILTGWKSNALILKFWFC